VNAGLTARLTLGRGARVRQSRDFQRLRREGNRVVCGGLLVNWQFMPEQSSRRLGVITSRKLGGAVVRNRVRRLIREAYRLHQKELRTGLELVIVARQSIVGKNFANVEKDFLTMIGKAGLRLDQRSQA
jgi:ribonuclease P protein component